MTSAFSSQRLLYPLWKFSLSSNWSVFNRNKNDIRNHLTNMDTLDVHWISILYVKNMLLHSCEYEFSNKYRVISEQLLFISKYDQTYAANSSFDYDCATQTRISIETRGFRLNVGWQQNYWTNNSRLKLISTFSLTNYHNIHRSIVNFIGKIHLKFFYWLKLVIFDLFIRFVWKLTWKIIVA